jgi:hypothetical protein
MKNRLRAMGMLRALREKLGRLNRVLMEAGSSDEDLDSTSVNQSGNVRFAIKQRKPLMILGRGQHFEHISQIPAR